MHRKLIPIVAVALGVTALAQSASAVVVFNNRGTSGNLATEVAAENAFDGDVNFGLLEDVTLANPGQYNINSVTLGFINGNVAPIATDVLVSFYDTVNYDSSPVTSSQIGSTYRFSLLAAPGASEATHVLTGGPLLVPNSSFGIVVKYVVPNTTTLLPSMYHLFQNVPIMTGSSDPKFAYDEDSDGAFASAESFVWNSGPPTNFPDANLWLAIDGAPVPEPGALALLGLSGIGLLRRRRMA